MSKCTPQAEFLATPLPRSMETPDQVLLQPKHIPIKAMRLPEIFGLSTFPVFRHCPTFDSQKSSENKSSLFRFRLSRKHTENLTEILESTGKCQKFRYIFDIFDIRRYMSKIDSLFSTYTV